LLCILLYIFIMLLILTYLRDAVQPFDIGWRLGRPRHRRGRRGGGTSRGSGIQDCHRVRGRLRCLLC
jgi:hypothetical protein